MHPVLFHVAGRPVESDGVLYFVAAVVAGVFVNRVASREGWNSADVLPGVVLVVVAAYVGARLLGAISPWNSFLEDPLGEILRPGGLSFFGGLALGSLAVVTYLRWKRYPVGEGADALAPIAPILYAIFRLGCLLNGDDYGPPTDRPWGMTFPEGSPPTTAPVHPTPIYEILLMIPVFLWLRLRRHRELPPAALTFELCVLMGTERFLVEFWRVGDPGPAGLTVSQWLAIALCVVGISGWIWVGRRARP